MVTDSFDAGLILAAEECPVDKFSEYHRFSKNDEIIIKKLIAHGPVLIRGGRGSGKSALLLEASNRMDKLESVFPIYLSLRYLPLLQSDGEEYIAHFCQLLSRSIQDKLAEQEFSIEFDIFNDQTSLKLGLNSLAQNINKRIVLLFDDAAHIGREKPLEVFFDLFRTLSSSLISCKASIYPGVTKFGIRFDVFNDSTVIDISRSDTSYGNDFFYEVLRTRYPRLAESNRFSDRLNPNAFSNLLGRAVIGNMRGFILACNRFDQVDKIGIPELSQCLLDMASDYFWPLMEEVAPKLGVYEVLVDPATNIFELIVEICTKNVKNDSRNFSYAKILINKQIVAHYLKIFEILEYLGFLARREASRALKSGGRGPVFSINLCSLLEATPSRRLTYDMVEEWLKPNSDHAEIYSNSMFSNIVLPDLDEGKGLEILQKDIDVLRKSAAYPYGLTDPILQRLKSAGINTVGELANASDRELDNINYIGDVKIKVIRDTVYQAIWM